MSNIKLFIRPETPPVKWEDFIQNEISNSVALDGYVIGESRFEFVTNQGKHYPMANFNHHENVNRYATRSTCAQVLLAIRSFLFDAFRDEKGNINLNVFVNDCDEDVCTSLFLLKNAYMFENTVNPKINRLISFEDMLDTTSGTYGFPKDLPFLKEMAWIFEPYREARMNGILSRKNPSEYKRIIEDVERRILAHIMGNGEKIDLDTSYEVIGGGTGWKMVKEIGGQARIGMISDEIKAFVTVQERNDGRFQYVIGKSSPFVQVFDIPELYTILNEAENCEDDCWGGSDTIGGSPRVKGSKLTPGEVEVIINDAIRRRR